MRNDVKIVRDWLGVNPRTGRQHLPDARKSSAALSRGLGVYQVEGLLIDLDLFTRLAARGQARGHEGLPDLQLALKLVTGRPFDQLRPGGWAWLYEGDRVDQHAIASVLDVARQVAASSSELGDPASTQAALRTAAKAAPHEELRIDDPAAYGQPSPRATDERGTCTAASSDTHGQETPQRGSG